MKVKMFIALGFVLFGIFLPLSSSAFGSTRVEESIPSGETTIVVMRKGATPYLAKLNVFLDGKKVGVLREKRYLKLKVKEGRHSVETRFSSFPLMIPPDKRQTDVDVHGGETIYVLLSNLPYLKLIGSSLPAATSQAPANKLSIIPGDDAIKMLSDFKESR